jgi:GDP-L-fucose synthase
MTATEDFFTDKSVLVTGGTGLIGRPLVRLLIAAGAKVTVASLDPPSRAPAGAEFVHADLRDFAACESVCAGKDYVFHLAGVKGSPAVTATRPATFFVPTLMFSINMMEAARRAGVARYLFASSVGVYAPAALFREDDVWTTFPSENDKFAGWAKRMGELQAEAYKIEYGWDKISIVRPANVYGPYDNFDDENSMVIPSLIRRALSGENPMTIWGDGSPIRDFIFAEDVARGMMLMVAQGVSEPVNLGSGRPVSIRQLVEVIVDCLDDAPDVAWDSSKPSGDRERLMCMERARKYGFEPQTSLAEGIAQTIDWYRGNKAATDKGYNAFTDPHLTPGR